MQLHELKPHSTRKPAKRVGRGGKRGKTSGRGHKGQKARAGNSTRPEMRDIIKKLPKLRGHGTNRARTVNAERVRPVVVNVSTLESVCEKAETVTPRTLVSKGVVEEKGKRAPHVKILGSGELTKKLTLTGFEVSESARAKIEAAGGTVTTK